MKALLGWKGYTLSSDNYRSRETRITFETVESEVVLQLPSKGNRSEGDVDSLSVLDTRYSSSSVLFKNYLLPTSVQANLSGFLSLMLECSLFIKGSVPERG